MRRSGEVEDFRDLLEVFRIQVDAQTQRLTYDAETVALISTSTSPSLGPSSRTFSILTGLPGSNATAALTSIVGPFLG